MFKFVKICSRWLYVIGIRIIVHSYSLHRIFVAKHKTNQFFHYWWMVSFFDVIYILSTCRDDKLLVTEWILLIFSVLKKSGAFLLVFHWPILRSQMFTFAILVSYVLVKMWNISRNSDFFNMTKRHGSVSHQVHA